MAALNGIIEAFEEARHFFGGSTTWAEWQNVCWVCEIDADEYNDLCRKLTHCRSVFSQDSIAVTVGNTDFV